MNIAVKATILAFGLGALTACETSTTQPSMSAAQANYLKAENIVRQYTGDGVCMRCFNIYRSSPNSKAFAMSKGGAFGVSSGQKTEAMARAAALKTCRSSAKGAGCKLLMVGDRFVWKD